MKIIVTESIASEGIDYLVEQGHDVDVKFGIARDELLDIIDQYDAIIVRSVTKVDKELIEKAVNLKVAGRAGNGVDNIDIKECTNKGIIVVNTPESNIMAAGELAVALAYASFRNIYQAVKGCKSGDFRRGNFIGNELDGKTAGVIGLGRIGSIVARKLKGSNMNVVAYDPYISDEKFSEVGVTKCETLDELLAQVDLITIHTPKTKETIDIIGADEIAKCKDGVRIVNAARGGLVNEDALYDALKSGKVAAAALDVLNPEPNYNLPPEKQDYTNKLIELDNFICTPHLGASTDEANFNVGTAVTKLVSDALAGKMVAAVNMPKIHSNLADLKPYLELAEMLGKIYYQVEKEQVKKVEICYSGSLAEKETTLISSAFIKGFLEPVCKENINFVNAFTFLSERGIDLVESKTKDIKKFTNLMTITFVADNSANSLSGTVFGQDNLRITDFFGYSLDFEPSEHIIAMQNRDIPGIIGKVGTILGTKGININAMQWSSKIEKNKAVSFICVDNEVDSDAIAELKNIEGVLKVTPMHF